MAGDILVDLGGLFLGSRLKRLSERLMADAAKIIRDAGLPIQPAHFPLLAAIDRYGPLTVGEAVSALGVSQPGVTRTAAGLVEMGLIEASRGTEDARLRTLRLTPAGEALMATAHAAIWPVVGGAVDRMCEGMSGSLLDQVAQVEAALDRMSLEDRAKAIAAERSALRIRDYTDDLAADFYRINAEWISTMFSLEENDIRILSHPRETIVDRGGLILFVEAPGIGVIGTCALIRIDAGVYELTKMGVSEQARGKKAGEFLLRHILERAEGMGIETLYLLTNSRCAPAIHLYEKLGFAHDAGIMAHYGSRYARCDVAMKYAPRRSEEAIPKRG